MDLRRDPFADRSTRLSAQSTATPGPGSQVAPQNCILVVPGGSASQNVALARAAHRLKSTDIPVLVISDRDPDDLVSIGADLFLNAPIDRLSDLCMALNPTAVLLPEDAGPLSSHGRRLATELNRSVAVRVLEINNGRVRCATNIAGYEREIAPASIYLIDARFGGTDPSPSVPVRASLPELPESNRPHPIATTNPNPVELELPEAEFVVSAGAGVEDLDLFHRFADALGATPGASRALVDAGRMPRDRQVGISGQITGARVYVAVGISGAVQHLEGMQDCRHVLSINLDKACAMAARAELSLVGDAQEVMKAVLEHLEVGE